MLLDEKAAARVYKANQISTIVDILTQKVVWRVYKANQISTIVDMNDARDAINRL